MILCGDNKLILKFNFKHSIDVFVLLACLVGYRGRYEMVYSGPYLRGEWFGGSGSSGVATRVENQGGGKFISKYGVTTNKNALYCFQFNT